MNCQWAREVLSAELDGEAPPGSTVAARAHLDRCAACCQWVETAHVTRRAARLGSPMPPSDLSQRVLAAVAADSLQRRERRYWLTVFALVAGVGALQVLATVPLLMIERSNPSQHTGHLLGLIEAVVGAFFVVGALVVLWKTREKSGLEVVGLDARTAHRSGAGAHREVA